MNKYYCFPFQKGIDNNSCYSIDDRAIPTIAITVKFIQDDIYNKIDDPVINEVSIRLTAGKNQLNLPLIKQSNLSWYYNFNDDKSSDPLLNQETYENKFASFHDFKALLIVNGSNYDYCLVEQVTWNVLKLMSGMAGLAFLDN